MTVLANSRYADSSSTVVRTPDSSGTYQQTVLRSIQITSQPYQLYVWKAGDRIDRVASDLLGDPTLWWQIVDANPELIDPFNIPVGSIIRVPQTAISGTTTQIQ